MPRPVGVFTSVALGRACERIDSASCQSSCQSHALQIPVRSSSVEFSGFQKDCAESLSGDCRYYFHLEYHTSCEFPMIFKTIINLQIGLPSEPIMSKLHVA